MDVKKATLILEGGASRGVFTAGILDYLLEKEIGFSDVIGVSAGACNALAYVANQKGRTKETMIHENHEYTCMNLKDFRKTKSILDMELMFETFAFETYPIDFSEFFSPKTNTYITVTNCETGKAEYYNEKESKEKVMRLCRASSSLPLFTPIVRIDDKPFLDGGLGEPVPIKRAQHLGNEKIVIILTRNPGYRKENFSKGVRKVYEQSYKKYPNLIRVLRKRATRYNETMREIEALEAEGKVFVFRPQIPVVKRLESDPQLLNQFYNHGYQLMERQYDSFMKFLES